MDAPLAMRGDVVKQFSLGQGQAALGFIQHSVIGFGFVYRHVLAPVQVGLVIQVEMLPAGQRAPGNQALFVEREGRISSPFGDHA